MTAWPLLPMHSHSYFHLKRTSIANELDLLPHPLGYPWPLLVLLLLSMHHRFAHNESSQPQEPSSVRHSHASASMFLFSKLCPSRRGFSLSPRMLVAYSSQCSPAYLH